MSDFLKDREWSTEPFRGYDMIVIPLVRSDPEPMLATWREDCWIVPSWHEDHEDPSKGHWVCHSVTEWPDGVRFSKL